METWILENSNYIRLSIFLGIFFIFGILELIIPDHKPFVSRKERWVSNIILVGLNNLILKIVLPFTSLMVADYVSKNQIGLFNLISIPYILKVVFAIILLDLIIYFQHVVFHKVPIFWKLHRMHHADLELDVTSGTRFHPIEIILSMLIKFASIYILGPSPLAVLLFEIILNGMAMFNHSNIKIYEPLEKFLGYLVITPSIHRIHHSIHHDELNTNFGFNLSIWDRLFNTLKLTYRDKLILGLKNFREIKYSYLWNLVLMPFIEDKKK
ncbi:MAG: sterol desaturase family protein [Leptospiraceae bacterium]|nr:sterol desaturase family protein [Leptospiraceae bacterium]